MKQKMDKIQNYFITNKKIKNILIILCFIGIIIGALYIVILSENDKSLVKDYISEYLSNLPKINYQKDLLQILITQFIFIFTIWLLGISVIGLPIILFLYFCKTFILGFSITSFIYTYGFKGILLSLGYIFPCQIINISVYLLLMNYSLSLSIRLLESFLKKEEISFKPIFKKYCLVFIFSFAIIILSNLLEVFIMPKIILWIWNFIS